ncbi:hypothetical protein QFC20_005268 [Naganishia adeliensis]|uniref:Uncharacterized protein n=1 Tax=Naganishia adeliensis TaxID=92952 RepID=A0ACC2VRI7_9TREE|nr:hypothetical protein QFC20_005268 [Naganishia adeliensis]
MSEQDAQESSREGASEADAVTYAEGYDDPNANVVILALAAKTSLRVHDYYLKASSPFFLDLLGADTEGGPVPLEGSSDCWRFILDQVIRQTTCSIANIELYAPQNAKDGYWQYLWSMIELRNLTERYMFASVSEYLHSEIMDCFKDNPPLVFAYACGLTPSDGNMAKAALSASRDRMPG